MAEQARSKGSRGLLKVRLITKASAKSAETSIFDKERSPYTPNMLMMSKARKLTENSRGANLIASLNF